MTSENSNMLGIERALRRQSGAPKVSLALKCACLFGTEREKDWDKAWSAAWEDRLLPRYTVTLGFDLSPLFSGAEKRDRAIDDAALTALFAKREASVNSFEKEASLIEARLRSAERQAVLFREAAEQTRLLLEDAEILASRGGLTVLEIETYRNQSLRREIEAHNAQDQLWYWRWLLSRRGR